MVHDLGRVYKASFNIPSGSDLSSVREWVELDLGETYNNIKIRKIGDENSIGSVSSMVSWDRI